MKAAVKNYSYLLCSTGVKMRAVPMARQFNIEHVHRSLAAELLAKANEIRHKYGPQIGWEELQRVLADREFAPFPCEIRFDAEPLLPGEFGHPVAKGPTRDDGYIIYIHPFYATQLASVPYLVLHQLVLINYGESATADDAETFGSVA